MKIRPAQPAPLAKKQPHTETRFGVQWSDDYAWMRDENWQAVMRDPSVLNADIRAHLETENAYTAEALAPLSELKDQIFAEMKGRLEPTARGVPMPDGPYAYFHFYREGDQHGVYARHDMTALEKNETPKDEVILDCDAEAKGKKFFSLGDVSHSPNHKWLAYSYDDKGSENYQVFLRNLDSGEVAPTEIDRSAGALVWAADNRTLFWVERDENQRPYAVRFRDVFDASAKTQTAYTEKDPGFFVSVGSSDDEKHIEISAHNHTTGEIHRIPSAAPSTPAVCFSPRQAGIEYSLSDQGGTTYILTNAPDNQGRGAVDFQIMTGVSGESPDQWRPYIPHQSGRLILGMESFENWLVRLEREDALPRLVIRNMKTDEEHAIDMPEAAYGLGIKSGYEYATDTLFFSYASPSRPGTVYRYDMKTRERTTVREQVVPSGHTPDDYRVERISITARDGETIPVTILARADVKIDGSNPCLLYGYGSYGITIPASFRTNLLSLVDRGMVYAIAHIRGGMSKGYQWYLDGKLEKKTNTFNDFVDAGRALAELGWTSEGKIVAHGGSAGGLLVGAAVNQAPQLFAGFIAAVPFVDVLTTMSDTELPLTPPEWPEWGNPITDEDAFKRLWSYSPYDNVTARHYPPALITGGLTDPRVTYWEPAKWAAKLREYQLGDGAILLKINMDAGHQGESGRYDSLKETALEYAFALDCVGLG
jgi:oligopeptidase B